MSSIEDLLVRSKIHAANFDKGHLDTPPLKKLVIVTCMDARINLYSLFGLEEGDAHVLRNAGGVVTDDTIRSLAISQRMLGTEEIVLIHHTECGLRTITDDGFKDAIEQETGTRPPWAVEAFDDTAESVRRSISRIKTSPFIPHKENMNGFIYDVHTGELEKISAPSS